MRQKTIVVSACLLGHKVRYDGAEQKHDLIIDTLAAQFELIPVCPEVSIGLSVPREKVELHEVAGKVCLQTTGFPRIDLTESMVKFAQQFLRDNRVAGMVLKDKSPSCGVNNCKQWNEQLVMHREGTGIFAATVMRELPHLPLLQSNAQIQVSQLLTFMQQVEIYAD